MIRMDFTSLLHLLKQVYILESEVIFLDTRFDMVVTHKPQLKHRRKNYLRHCRFNTLIALVSEPHHFFLSSLKVEVDMASEL